MKTLFYNSIELPEEVHIVSGLFLCYNFGETISKYGSLYGRRSRGGI